MPIIKRNLYSPAHYLADFNLTIQAAQQSLIEAYLRSFRCAFLALIVVSTSVAITRNVSADADTATANHQRMLATLKQIADQTAETNNYIGEGLARQLRRHIANLSVDVSNLNRWRLHTELGEAELRLGNEEAAIDQLTQAGRLLPQLRGQLSPLMANQTLFRLGVAYMRRGETQNCCPKQIGAASNPDSCILPLREGGIHIQQESSLQAITYFTEVLRNTTVELPLHLEARWLLNIAYMTVGGYPDQVPEPYLLPQEAFQSEKEMPRFANIAPHLGLDTFDLSGGAIVDDFDNDNYLDIVASTWDPRRTNSLFPQ